LLALKKGKSAILERGYDINTTEADMSNQEQERLKRLREQQLQARDPMVKQRNIQRNISVKEKKLRKKFSLIGAWRDFPKVVRMPILALLIGGAITIILPSLWDSPYATIAGAGVTVVMILFAVVLGNALDLRDEIKDHMKH
jgi:uncharacterized membrane protein YraQ (UPF0718 family)